MQTDFIFWEDKFLSFLFFTVTREDMEEDKLLRLNFTQENSFCD